MRCISVCLVALFVSIYAQAQEPADTAKVYVCTGSASYAYHTHRGCPGLNKCTATIKTMTVKDAKKEGRKFCGYCRGNKPALRLRDDKKVTKSEDVM